MLEYAVGAATVAIGWSQTLVALVGSLGLRFPNAIAASPFQGPMGGGVINLPAVAVVVAVSLVLIRGIRESATVNSIIVVLKVTVILVFIAIGWSYMVPANHTPLIPPNEGEFGRFGWSGILAGAAAQNSSKQGRIGKLSFRQGTGNGIADCGHQRLTVGKVDGIERLMKD